MTKFGVHENVNTTVSRGVEVKELEIANINLDRNTNSCSGSVGAEGSARAAPPAAAPATPPTPPTLDSSNSYIQVAVQQRGASAGGVPRLPHSSSPLRQLYRLNHLNAASAIGESGACAEPLLLVPASLVLPAHAHAAHPHRHESYTKDSGGGGAGGERTLGEGYAHAAPDTGAAGDAHIPLKTQKSWRILNNINGEKFDFIDNGPERVEVYYFEQGGSAGAAFLATSEAGGVSACERWAGAGARAAHALFAPLPAAAALLLAPPTALIITLERCALMAVRDLVTGVVQTASDYLVKPALALAFNAALRPPLVLAANVGRALRSALAPLWLAAADAVQPAAELLRALNLVTVHVHRAPDTPYRPEHV